MLSRAFDSQTSLFHMVFNRNVENCHASFTIPLFARKLVQELLAMYGKEAKEFSVVVVIRLFSSFQMLVGSR
jgi:hypothetical protein